MRFFCACDLATSVRQSCLAQLPNTRSWVLQRSGADREVRAGLVPRRFGTWRRAGVPEPGTAQSKRDRFLHSVTPITEVRSFLEARAGRYFETEGAPGLETEGETMKLD